MFPTIEFYNRNSGKMWDNKLVLCFKSIKFPVKKNKGMKLLLTMGRLCYKGPKEEHNCEKEKRLKNSSKILLDSSSQDEAVVEVDSGYSYASSKPKSTQHSEKSVGSKSNHVLYEENTKTQMRKQEVSESGQEGEEPRICRVLSVRNGNDGAQVVAGWPSWLTAVAGEAIKGWIPRRAESFEKMDKIGQGTYSSVYRARDLEAKKNVALKKVRFINMDPESVRFMAREILVLRRLDHPNVMKLEGLVTSKVSGNLYLVFEYMEHDLAGLAASAKVKFTEAQIKCYMKQLFCGLEHCHNRGVLHRDIKGANLLIDNDGNLKIGDFGLATFYRANRKQALTSRVVTLWYRPPELLLGSTEYGVAVDLWSSGCILAELLTGKPIMPGRTEVEQLHKIFKLCGSPPEEYWSRSNIPHSTIFKPQQPYKRCVAEVFKDFPSSALALVQSLLAFEPESRGSTTSALNSVFFTTNPLPCNPSSLPKYPPSKELDAKARNEEARRQKKMSRTKSSENGSKESKALAELNATAEQQLLQQKWKGQTSINLKEEGVSGRGSLQDRQMVMDEVPQVVLKNQRSYRAIQATAARLSRFSNSVASGGGCCSQLDFSNRNVTANSYWPLNNDAESSHYLLGRQDFCYKTNNGQMPRKETTTGYTLKKTRIHYSGPLLPHGSSVEEMLKEHEKQIQIAVRKAREKSNKRQER